MLMNISKSTGVRVSRVNNANIEQRSRECVCVDCKYDGIMR